MPQLQEPLEPSPTAPEEDQTAAPADAGQAVVAPELVADTFGEYISASWARVKAGESGVLPVVIGLILISIIFQTLNSKFLTAGNLVNLLVQGAVFILLAMAEVFPLVLGEIDLSAGFVGRHRRDHHGRAAHVAARRMALVGRLARRAWSSAASSGVSRARSSPGSSCRRSSSPWLVCSSGRA